MKKLSKKWINILASIGLVSTIGISVPVLSVAEHNLNTEISAEHFQNLMNALTIYSTDVKMFEAPISNDGSGDVDNKQFEPTFDVLTNYGADEPLVKLSTEMETKTFTSTFLFADINGANNDYSSGSSPTQTTTSKKVSDFKASINDFVDYLKTDNAKQLVKYEIDCLNQTKPKDYDKVIKFINENNTDTVVKNLNKLSSALTKKFWVYTAKHNSHIVSTKYWTDELVKQIPYNSGAFKASDGTIYIIKADNGVYTSKDNFTTPIFKDDFANLINTIFVEHNGSVYFNAGTSIYSYKDGKLTTVGDTGWNRNFDSFSFIGDTIFASISNSVYVSTDGFKKAIITLPSDADESIAKIEKIVFDEKTKIIVLAEITYGKSSNFSTPHIYTSKDKFKTDLTTKNDVKITGEFSDLMLASDGTIYVGTSEALYGINETTTIIDKSIAHHLMEKDGVIYFTTFSGVYKYDKKTVSEMFADSGFDGITDLIANKDGTFNIITTSNSDKNCGDFHLYQYTVKTVVQD